jgi:CoA:oxalate CoA-transferase
MTRGSALARLKVIDLGQMVAAPFCAALLADMGADVIKVERPGRGDISRNSLPKQDGVSTYFIAFNHSKRGIAIDLKSEEGKEILRKLILEADVLIENFRPGVMKRLGFSYEDTKKLNPRLIYASISGFGQTGTYAEWACFDPIAQAMSGMMSVTGSENGEMVRCGASIADIMAGQNAAIAILAALEHRHKSGQGQWIDVSLMDSCIVALSSMNQVYFTTGKVPVPKGNCVEFGAPSNSYPTSDGYVVISVGQNTWGRFTNALNHPEWFEDERFATNDLRMQNRRELDELISIETRRYTSAQLVDILHAAKLPAAPVLRIDQVVSDPFFSDTRDMFTEVNHPQIGTVRITNPGIKMSETNPYVRGCAPLLGQHNEQVLKELGYSESDIQTLKEHKVL